MEPKRMEKVEVEAIVRGLRSTDSTTTPGQVVDGNRIHVYYKTMPNKRTPTQRAIEEAQRASDLGIERQRLTGVVSSVFKSKADDLCVCMRVELERSSQDGKPIYRTLNITKGDVVAIAVIG